MNTVKKSQSKSGRVKTLQEYLSEIKEQVCFSEFEGTDDEARAEELCLIIAEVMMLPDNTPDVIKIKKQPIKAAAVKFYYARLDYSDICHVIEHFSKINYQITDIKAYLRKALYNSVFEAEHYLANEVNRWMK